MRWVDPKAVALAVGVTVATVYEWCRRKKKRARRTAGRRGHWRIAVDADGWPLDA